MNAGQASAPHSLRLGIALLIFISLFWGMNWPVMKLAVSQLPIWSFRSLCLLAGGFGLLAIAKLAGQNLKIERREVWPLIGCAFFNTTVWHLMSAAGLTELAAGRAAILAFTMPVWAAMLAVPLLREPLTPRRLLALGLGIAAVALLVLPDWRNVVAAPLGVIFMLAAAIAWAIGTVWMKKVDWQMSSAGLAAWQMLIGGIPIYLGALLLERDFDPTSVSALVWLAMGYIVIFAMWGCHWAWFGVVAIFPASVAAIGSLAIPVIGVASSSLALGESVGWDAAGALVLVVAAIALATGAGRASAAEAKSG